MIKILKNRMSSIPSKLFEGNRPTTFHILRCWIILSLNFELKSGDLFVCLFVFCKKFYWEIKKIKEMIREEKMEKTKARKKTRCWTVHSWIEKNNPHKHNSCIIPMLIKKTIVAASYSLGGISSLSLVFSLVMSSFISWNISSSYHESFINSFYN